MKLHGSFQDPDKKNCTTKSAAKANCGLRASKSWEGEKARSRDCEAMALRVYLGKRGGGRKKKNNEVSFTLKPFVALI